MKNYKYIVVLIVAALLFVPKAQAQNEQPYLCELGLQGGCGYYVGDAAPHIFTNVREAYGIHFRYKFTNASPAITSPWTANAWTPGG